MSRIVLVALCLSATMAQGHNGAVALAHPVSGVVIDGDLSDWPGTIPAYPIARAEYGVVPSGPEDLTAQVRYAFDVSRPALLIAVEVTDDVPLVDPRPDRSWDSEDGIEIYLDTQHDERSDVRQYVLRGDGTPEQRHVNAASEVAVAWQRQGTKQHYEWRIDLPADLLQGLQSGRTLSVDVVVCDADADGSFSWVAWGRRTAKVGPPNRRGDVVLLADPEGVGPVEGRTRWEGEAEGVSGANIRVRAVTDAELQVRLMSGADGHFQVDLPPGEYAVQAEIGARPWAEVPLHVVADQGGEVVIEVPLPQGVTRTLGPGTQITAGHGERRGAWLTHGVIDGVQGGLTTSIVQDRSGHLWFGTQGGLHRYDGARIQHYGVADGLLGPQIRSLHLSSDGALWIGCSGGLMRLEDGQLTGYTTRDGLIDQQIEALLEGPDGSIWVGTNSGLSRFRSGRFINYTSADGPGNNTVWSLARDLDENIWIGTRGAGLLRFDGDVFTSYSTERGLAGDDIRALHVDAEGVLWIASESGLSRRQDGDFTSFTMADGLPRQAVSALTTDPHGDLWLSACDVLYEPGAQTPCQPVRMTKDGFQTWSDLGTTYLFDLFADREGNVWAAMTGGLARYDAGDFRTWTTQEGLPGNTVNSVHEDGNGRMWFGTSAGLARLDGDQFTTWTVHDGLPHDLVHDIVEDADGVIWAGTEGGLVRVDGDELTSYSEADVLPYNRIMRLSTDSDGTLWMASMGGGVLTHRDGIFDHIGVEDGLPNTSVLSVQAHPEGGVWATVWNAGLSHLTEEGARQYGAEDGLPQRSISSIFVDRDGQLWLASAGAGIGYLGADGFSHLNQEEGMVQDVVGISQSRDGTLWLSSSTGISHYDGSVFQSLLKRDGLADNSVREVIEDREGNMWVATLGSGVTRYRPVHAPPPIAISDVIGERRHGPVAAADIPSSAGLLAIEFHGISFRTRPGSMQYRYRLAGHDEEWQFTSKTRVEYANLPTGTYRFEVSAIDRDLVESQVPATVEVEIHLPFEQILLWSVLGLTLIGSIWLGWQLVQRNRARDRRQRETVALSSVRQAVWNLSSSSELEKVMPAVRQALEHAQVPFAKQRHQCRGERLTAAPHGDRPLQRRG
ncbi:MAG: hypothetical protein HOH74_09460 [Gemmatimonadetes bacterium]|nr:hypothetical protein [Gemmatimonadota bacterium]